MEYHIRDVSHRNTSVSKRMEAFYFLWLPRKELDDAWIPRKVHTAIEGN